jgi:hypothetical protein
MVKLDAVVSCRCRHHILTNIRTYRYYIVQKSKRKPSLEGYVNVSVNIYLYCTFVCIIPEKYFRWFQPLYSKCSMFPKL